MSDPRPTTLQRHAPEILDVLAEDVRVLNDRASEDNPGGGDVDCAALSIRPHWPLRLRDWRLCQAFWYDATAAYYVFVRDNETLAVDVLDDPAGIGRYWFPTSDLSRGTPSGSLATATERATYLTLKRTVKDLLDSPRWSETQRLASVDLDAYRTRLVENVGDDLGAEMLAIVTADAPPTAAMLSRWRRRLRGRRIGQPRRSLELWALSTRRIAHRFVHPTGLVVALVGPDGSGKSTIAEALPETCGQLFRRHRRVHFTGGVLPRPGRIVRRDASDASVPHARVPHGRLLSVLLLAYHWVNAVLAHMLVIGPTRTRSGLVVIERGFVDIAVDSTRYRLTVPSSFVRTLARLLPAPDLTVILDAPAELVVARKPELPVVEIERQSQAWQALVRGPRSLSVDASRPPGESLREIRDRLAHILEQRTAAVVCGGWAALPSRSNPRLFVPRTSRKAAAAAVELEAPSKRSSRITLRVARAAVRCGATRLLPATAPPEDVRRLLAPHVPPGCTIGVRRSLSHTGRYVAVVIDLSGAPLFLAKIAMDAPARSRLHAEQHAVRVRAELLRPPLRAPRIAAVDENVLLYEWISYGLRRRPWFLSNDVARGLGEFFAAGMHGVAGEVSGPAHGDAAPWNFLRTGREWVLVDWEDSFDDAPPFFDVFHHLVQSCSHLARPHSVELLRALEGEGWAGDAIAAYADGAGLPTTLVVPSFRRYLEITSTPPTMRDPRPRSVELRRKLISEVGT